MEAYPYASPHTFSMAKQKPRHGVSGLGMDIASSKDFVIQEENV